MNKAFFQGIFWSRLPARERFRKGFEHCSITAREPDSLVFRLPSAGRNRGDTGRIPGEEGCVSAGGGSDVGCASKGARGESREAGRAVRLRDAARRGPDAGGGGGRSEERGPERLAGADDNEQRSGAAEGVSGDLLPMERSEPAAGKRKPVAGSRQAALKLIC